MPCCIYRSKQRQASSFFPYDAEHSTLLMFVLHLGALAYIRSQYGAGTDPVYLNDVRCSGFEDSLINCSRSDFGDVSLDCLDHSEDVFVFCPSECYGSIIKCAACHSLYSIMLHMVIS